MAVDIVGYLNTALTDWTAQEKLNMLNDFCEQCSYQEGITPVSKKKFMNMEIVEYIKGTVNAIRIKKAKEAAEWTELDGSFAGGE